MNDFVLKRIEFGSKEYEEELVLRDRILRKPLGLDLLCEVLTGEENDIHIGAFCGQELIGVTVLTKTDEVSLRMRQVAVREDKQRTGVGKRAVEFCETEAEKEGFKRIHLHARKTAVEFYKRLGYVVVGEEFFEIGIPHNEMEKRLI